ncbi:hypothetical protein HII36_17545 [Nonomuraea sp. NN258]|uniref:hypothetical protein n=1 Tax=Nonomuraea antri TaxID=2730852 RepID=UPI001569731B|nr:hypothetical protein [Nonomuraea antri]NRQ33640.1 hypothetical protein [Nonomuraea antri]
MRNAHTPLDGEQWQPGDLVVDADGGLFTRAGLADQDKGLPWGYPRDLARLPGGGAHVPEGELAEEAPARPLTLLLRDGHPVLPAAPANASAVLGTQARQTAAGVGVGGLYLAATAFDPDGAGDPRAAKLRADLLDTVVVVESTEALGAMFGGAADGLLVELAEWHRRSVEESA